ncbi:DUF296 domain-containing protein [Chitinophaga costaii]|nr:DUF296 domain-containing protein [Chitinophaga costaii]
MQAQNLSGKGWKARKVESTYIVSVSDKTSIVAALTDFVVTQQIKAGQVTGIGATNSATLRFFDPKTKNYVDKTFSEQMEISNITGNISEAEGKPLLHLHVTLGKSDYSAITGHLQDATIRGAGEFYIYPLNSRIVKVKNEAIGLNIYDFEQE